VLAARANQGSNSIEGYNISTEDAIAAIQGATEPMDSSWQDWQANLGYRRAMTYVLQLASDPHFEYNAILLRSLHFMMTEHGLDAGSGLWRPGPIWVRNDATGEVVYEGAESEYVPALVEELITSLSDSGTTPAIVRAAMAHLNLVLIHPFRDGNGRMARCLQSLVLVRGGFLAREYCNIEEYLGQSRNQQRYYQVFGDVGRGRWAPENDARPWVRFCIEAHYIQALSVLRRVKESEWVWNAIEHLTDEFRLPERSVAALFDASLDLKIRNASYRATLAEWGEEIANQTATSDLQTLVKAGVLEQHGAKRGTYYVAGQPLKDIQYQARQERETISAAGLFLPLPAQSVSPTEPEPLPLQFATDAQTKAS